MMNKDNCTPKLLCLGDDGDKKKVDKCRYYLSVRDLLEVNNHLPNHFYVDLYQREYCWTNKEAEELFNDIMSSSRYHYIGLFWFGADDPSKGGYPIIDGQQRLITIFLFLHYLGRKNEGVNNFEITIITFDERNIYKISSFLSPSEEKHDLIYMRYKKNVERIYKKIEDLLGNIMEDEKQKFEQKILNKLCFFAIRAADKEKENIMFRNLNTKGIQLDDVDKVKGYLLSEIYNDETGERNIDTFKKHWKIIINGESSSSKRSANLFFKILAQNLEHYKHQLNGDNSNKKNPYKYKYNELVKLIEELKNDDFYSKLKNNVEIFRELPKIENFKKGINSNEKNNVKNLRASFYYIYKLKLHGKFVQEIAKSWKFQKYKDGSFNPIILSFLYLFTYICETDCSFTGSDAQEKIDLFQGMDEKNRKERLKELLEKLDNKKIDGITFENKCAVPLLLIAKSQAGNFLEEIVKYENAGPSRDHFFPKRLLEEITPSTMRCFFPGLLDDKDDNDIDCTPPDEKIKNMIKSFANIRLEDNQYNKNKGRKIDKEYLKKNNNNKFGIDYDKMREKLEKTKEELINDIKKSVLNLLSK